MAATLVPHLADLYLQQLDGTPQFEEFLAFATDWLRAHAVEELETGPMGEVRIRFADGWLELGALVYSADPTTPGQEYYPITSESARQRLGRTTTTGARGITGGAHE